MGGYYITITHRPVPLDEEKAVKFFETIIDESNDEPSEELLALVEKYKEKYPCICDLPDDQIDEGVWCDGPLSTNVTKNGVTLGIRFSAPNAENVLMFVFKTALDSKYLIFDHLSGQIIREMEFSEQEQIPKQKPINLWSKIKRIFS